MLPPRVGLITLACRDIERLAAVFRSLDEVRSAYETLLTVPDIELLGGVEEAFWGGGFSWRDPEGNIWDVAWAEGSTIDDRGGLTFP